MKHRILLTAMLAIAPLVSHADTDDFGVWTEIGVEKSITKQWSLGLEGEMRTGDNCTAMNRLSAGLKVGYKPIKYLKLAASYSFINKYKPEKTSRTSVCWAKEDIPKPV